MLISSPLDHCQFQLCIIYNHDYLDYLRVSEMREEKMTSTIPLTCSTELNTLAIKKENRSFATGSVSTFV